MSNVVRSKLKQNISRGGRSVASFVKPLSLAAPFVFAGCSSVQNLSQGDMLQNNIEDFLRSEVSVEAAQMSIPERSYQMAEIKKQYCMRDKFTLLSHDCHKFPLPPSLEGEGGYKYNDQFVTLDDGLYGHEKSPDKRKGLDATVMQKKAHTLQTQCMKSDYSIALDFYNKTYYPARSLNVIRQDRDALKVDVLSASTNENLKRHQEKARRDVRYASFEVLDAIMKVSKGNETYLPFMVNTALMESSFNPSAESSTTPCVGLYQLCRPTFLSIVKTTAEKYGYNWRTKSREEILNKRNDPLFNAQMTLELLKDNERRFRRKGHKKIVLSEQHRLHYWGLGDAVRFGKLLKSKPDAIAADYFKDEARDNQSVFYVNSKLDSPRTVVEVQEYFSEKLSYANQLAKAAIERWKSLSVKRAATYVSQQVNSTGQNAATITYSL